MSWGKGLKRCLERLGLLVKEHVLLLRAGELAHQARDCNCFFADILEKAE